MKYVPPYGAPGVDDPYVNGDPSIARQGSIIPAGAVEHPQRELVNFISASNVLPSEVELDQLTKSARSQWVNFCVDSGAANALSVALTPALTEYRQGFPLRVLCSKNNTGATTININSLGNRPIVRPDLTPLQANDLRAGMLALLVDDGSRFQMLNYLGAVGGVSTVYNIDIPYAEDTAPAVAPNGLIANYGAAFGAVPAVAGDVVLVKVKNTNTGPVTIAINALAPQPVRRNDGLPLDAYDLLGAECILIEYNTTYWQMLRLVRSQVFFKLATDLTLYVRTDGSDSNDGGLNTSARAFRTIQGAIDFVARSYLIAGRTVTIVLGQKATYIGTVRISNLPGSVIIMSDPTDPNNITVRRPDYIIQGTMGSGSVSNPTIAISGSGTTVQISGVTISPVDTRYDAIAISNNASVSLSDITFAGINLTTGAAGVNVGAATCNISNYIDFNTSMGRGVVAQQGGQILAGLWFTLINTHGQSFYDTFAMASNLSTTLFAYGYCTFTGGASGVRYRGLYTSTIMTAGGPANFLPGNVAGEVDATSIYA